MHLIAQRSPTEFVMTALGATAPSGKVATCGLCGTSAPGKPAASVLKSGFTNWDELHSDRVCWACESALADRRTRSSLVVDASGYRRVERREIWPLLLEPPEPPWISFFSVSGKKHGLFRQAMASSRESFRVQVEDMHADFDRAADREWMRVLSEVILAGARRDNALSGHYDHGDYHRLGYARIRDTESILSAERNRRARWMTITSVMPGRADLQKMTW